MTIYETVKAESAKTLKLLNLLVDTTTGQPAERANVLQQVRVQLRSQYGAEAASLYPLLLHDARTEEVARACRDEKRALEELLEELQRTPPTDATFQYKAEALAAQAEGHAQREEHELFPLALRVIPEEQAVLLAEQMRREQEKMAHQWRPLSARSVE